MIGHVDGDVLVYEIGFAAEASWRYWHAQKGKEVESPPPFDYVHEMMTKRIAFILQQAEVDEAIFYLTGRHNFRYHIAQTTPYKERVGNKPFHYKNVKAVMQQEYNCMLEEGLEADDLIALYLKNGVAISRDKDIRQIPGIHYSWEMENQPAIGPHKCDEFGSLVLKGTKLLGYGDKYLMSQILTGDSVDSIPGCPNYGPKKAMAILDNCTSVAECLNAIIPVYQKCYKLEWKTVLREQARLVNLVRKYENGKALLWDFPGEDETWIDVLSGQITQELQSVGGT